MNVKCNYDELMTIKELKKRINPENNNKHDKDQIKQLAGIFEYQGIRKPIYLNKDTGKIQAGHGRLASAIFNKYDNFPVEFQDYDSEEMAYADLTADNAIANQADLDLSMVNAKLQDIGPDFDLDMLGIKDFNMDFEPGTIEDQGKLDETKITIMECPHCGESFEQKQAKIID